MSDYKSIECRYVANPADPKEQSERPHNWDGFVTEWPRPNFVGLVEDKDSLSVAISLANQLHKENAKLRISEHVAKNKLEVAEARIADCGNRIAQLEQEEKRWGVNRIHLEDQVSALEIQMHRLKKRIAAKRRKTK